MAAKKHSLGTGAKNGVSKRPNTSYTSAQTIRRRKRQAECLDYRLQGHSYRVIGEAMHISPSLAHEYVCRALKEFVPPETAQQVLQQELESLSQMQAAIFANAAGGETASIEATLRIMAHRAKLLSLGAYSSDKNGGHQVHFNINGPAPAETEEGIVVTFVTATKWGNPDAERIDGGPVLDLPVNGNGGSKG
jgi:hypothetical protein